jgi:hypothetical protein
LYENKFLGRWHSWFLGNPAQFVGPCIDDGDDDDDEEEK